MGFVIYLILAHDLCAYILIFKCESISNDMVQARHLSISQSWRLVTCELIEFRKRVRCVCGAVLLAWKGNSGIC